MPETYDNVEADFFIVEQILAFASSTNLVRECLQISKELYENVLRYR